MIYISLSGLTKPGLKNTIKTLNRNGFRNIELSGAFNFYKGIDSDLVKLKKQLQLNYILHNYFPHFRKPFVLNLASLNDRIYRKTLDFLKQAIKLSKKLGAAKFGLHAGFFLDIGKEEIGRPLSYRRLFDRKRCVERFCDGFNILKEVSGNLELYIENNVISYKNLKNFKKLSPLMMTNYNEYAELKRKIDFKLLLDIGHLKVSSNALGLDFEDELDKTINSTDYLHLSDNNGFCDQNRPLSKSGRILKLLKNYNLRDKLVTLEINGGIDNIRKTYDLLKANGR